MANLESLRSSSVTRQVNYYWTKIGVKCKTKISNETFLVIFKDCVKGMKGQGTKNGKNRTFFFYFRVLLHLCQIHKDIPGFVIAFLEEDGELFEEDPEDVTKMI